VWQATWYDLHDGLAQLVNRIIDESNGLFDQQRALHVVVVVIMVSRGAARCSGTAGSLHGAQAACKCCADGTAA
jgi:hypothetical protein